MSRIANIVQPLSSSLPASHTAEALGAAPRVSRPRGWTRPASRVGGLYRPRGRPPDPTGDRRRPTRVPPPPPGPDRPGHPVGSRAVRESKYTGGRVDILLGWKEFCTSQADEPND